MGSVAEATMHALLALVLLTCHLTTVVACQGGDMGQLLLLRSVAVAPPKGAGLSLQRCNNVNLLAVPGSKQYCHWYTSTSPTLV
jgi:hypothetical protein